MPTVSAQDLTCLRGARLVFEGLGFDLDSGDALLLTGPNGSGKSSLIRVLAGLIEPLDGRLEFDGRALDEDRDGHRHRTFYLGHQDPIKPTLSIRETLAFSAALRGVAGAGRIDAALAALNLTDLAETRGAVLSSGQRRRTSLARLLVCDAEVWLMDEPTVGLDTASVALVEAMVAAHRAKGGIVVLSTHIEFALPGAKTLDLGDFTPAAFLQEAPV